MLRGPVDDDGDETGGSTSLGNVSILDVSIVTNASTIFEDGDVSGTDFFLVVEDGDLVEYTDYNEQGLPADGVADEVEFED